MDALQNKVNVISWITPYKGSIIKHKGRKFVEFNHRNGMNKWFFSAPDEDSLLKKLDNFLVNRLTGKIPT